MSIQKPIIQKIRGMILRNFTLVAGKRKVEYFDGHHVVCRYEFNIRDKSGGKLKIYINEKYPRGEKLLSPVEYWEMLTEKV